MHYFKFLFYELILFGLIIIANYFYDSNLNPPFTKVDVMASIVFLPILGYLLFMLIKLFKRFDNILLKNKIILSIPTFILSALVIGIIFSCFDIQ
ncbi:hypothetical protein [Oceanobacillus sp. Castelsardo]|uniref:hypothetical protein n=1 Tax=Oceanobacillus sp. Castelsardo TaxID=1851204 RepID=UPI0009EE9404|nr:hypothetical protein [Oceanobacillus sp. Castelsardo]